MATVEDLLFKTSRTFALAIPLLPEPLRREVGVSYLVFRVADTLEDATRWHRNERLGALGSLGTLLAAPDAGAAAGLARAWSARPPLDHPGYRELLAELPWLVAEVRALSAPARACVLAHAGRTVDGMITVVERAQADGALRLGSVSELQAYCHVVAGIVGEMLTELVLLAEPELHPVAADLRQRAGRFGEGLQLVNILKDAAADAGDGRVYLPPSVPVDEVFRLARADLGAATEYVLALQRGTAQAGVVAFNALLVQLAWASLARVEDRGPGAKLSRPEVMATVGGVHEAIAQGRPAVVPPA